jgi:hypothetical protein
MVAVISPRKADAQSTFQALCRQRFSPEQIMMARLNNTKLTDPKTGAQVPVSKKMYDAAKDLIAFRLPRLNSIDAVMRNVDMTHDEWIETLEKEEANRG